MCLPNLHLYEIKINNKMYKIDIQNIINNNKYKKYNK
jgi:hypothetical protein